PLGIQDMRFAKAEYIRALKDLRAADAEYVRAQAAFELARARYKDAQTANLNADTEYQNLLNEYQQLINEARQDTNDFIAQEIANRIDSVKKRMELREKEHAAKMVAAEDSLAMAQERLRITLRNIALYSQSLTPDEQYALMDAVDMYEAAVEATADQTIVVLQAQRTLDSLKMVREVGPDTAYDKDSKAYVGAIEKWKGDIEDAEIEQALVLALLLAVPDSLVYDDVDAWKAQIDALVEDSTALAYNKYQVKTEMASYYTANIHDGVKVFNAMIEEFKEENGTGYPSYTADQKKLIKEGEKTKDDFKKAPNSDSIKFANFPIGDVSPASFNKFGYLLSSYVQESPYSKAEPKNNIIDTVMNGANFDTIFIVGPVKQDMKAFILGAAGNGENSQKDTFNEKEIKANYGLWGAYDILEREYVTKQKDAKTAEQIAELKKAMEAKDSIWTAHRDILKNGLTKYEPYVKALAAVKTAMSEESEAATAMAAAVDQLAEAFASVNGSGTPSKNDSVRIIDAFKAFAAAREAYLDYTYDPEKQPHDSTYFVFCDGTKKSGKAVVDSVKFTDLTYEALADSTYAYSTETGDPLGGINGAIAAIASQLLNTTIGSAIKTASSVAEWDVLNDPANINAGTPDYNAFYTRYKYVAKVGDTPAHMVNADDTPYESKDLKDAKAAVLAAVASYVDVYNQFWGLADSNCGVVKDSKGNPTGSDFDANFNAYFTDKKPATLKNAEKAVAEHADLQYDPMSYSLATFKPYSDEDKTPIVTFTGTAVDETPAVLAILTAVDPAAAAARTNNNFFKGNMSASVLLDNNATAPERTSDLYKAMKAEYDYWAATTEVVVKDLEVIKAWIQGVEDTFVADATVDDGTKGYNDWKTKYADAKKAKAKYDKYDEALKEFTGVDEDGEALGIVGPLTDPSAATIPGQEFANISSVLMAQLVEPETVYGYYPGEWSEDLGGAQLAAAQELFPEYPEKIAEWDETIKDTEDELLHYATLIQAAKKAYFATAQIADENVDNAANWDQLVENYKKANENYRKRLVGIIEKLQGEIETLEERIAKFNQGIPQLDIAIAEAEKELKVETARLQGYEEALAYAKANLDKLMEYIKSLDANFVVPAFDPTKII
ncbi:MAG: hypothetical protein IKW91_05670, partial [Bacteroidaceae bacterium]|nr:hypothetical protein [Bacteroidaceae bacterium]